MIADAGYIKLTVIILLFGLLIYLSVVSIREGDEVDVYENPNLGTKYANSGFSFTAFFFSFLWAFVSNLWEIGFYLLAVYVTLSLLGLFMYPIAVLLGLLIHVFIGFKANDWKATSLLTRGYRYQRTLKKQFLRGLSPITDVKRNSKILIRQLITHIKHNIKFEAFLQSLNLKKYMAHRNRVVCFRSE